MPGGQAEAAASAHVIGGAEELTRCPWPDATAATPNEPLAELSEDELLGSDGSVARAPKHHHLVEIHASWCSACKLFAPSLHAAMAELQARRTDVLTARIDGAAHSDIIAHFGIKEAPTMLLFRAGERERPLSLTHVSAFVTDDTTSEDNIRISADRIATWMDAALRAAGSVSSAAQRGAAEDDNPLARCLLTTDKRSWSHVLLPPGGLRSPFGMYATCRNQTCVEEVHATQWGGHFAPNGDTPPTPALPSAEQHPFGAPARRVARGALGELPGQRVVPIEELACVRDGDDVRAVRRAREAFATSHVLVLRGCAAGMPAMTWWRNNSRLRGQPGAERVFAPLLDGVTFDSVDRLDDAAAWAPDLTWPSALSDELLERFTRTPHVWVSRGEKDAAMHFDTVDNMHVVVADAKQFDLLSPEELPHLYVDFPPQTQPDAAVRCPDRSAFGCDDFGCYGYVPFDQQSVDLDEFPLVARAAVHTATLAAGDVLVLPAYWTHRVRHHLLGGGAGARNIGLAFTRPHPRPSASPYAHDIQRWWRALQGGGGAGPSLPPSIMVA